MRQLGTEKMIFFHEFPVQFPNIAAARNINYKYVL